MSDLKRRWGRAVRERRIALKLSQAVVAQLAGIDQSTISRIEKGQHCPSEDMKRRLAAALDQPIGALFTYPDEVPALPRAVAS